LKNILSRAVFLSRLPLYDQAISLPVKTITRSRRFSAKKPPALILTGRIKTGGKNKTPTNQPAEKSVREAKKLVAVGTDVSSPRRRTERSFRDRSELFVCRSDDIFPADSRFFRRLGFGGGAACVEQQSERADSE
jgi:hypothetical protein